MLSLLLLLLACGSEEEDRRTPAQRADADARALWKASETPAPPAPVAPAQPATGDRPTTTEAGPAPAAAATFQFQGINTLYKSFFADPSLQAPLLAALAGRVEGAPAIHVRYDELAVRGHITLAVPPGGLLQPVRVEGGRVQVQDLAPLTVALDDYRLGLGARYDLRLLNFRVGVELRGGGRTCTFVAAGEPPPDGSVVSPCVEVGGERVCGEPGPQGVRFAPEVQAAILACLGR